MGMANVVRPAMRLAAAVTANRFHGMGSVNLDMDLLRNEGTRSARDYN
jgi:hypothetical protein